VFSCCLGACVCALLLLLLARALDCVHVDPLAVSFHRFQTAVRGRRAPQVTSEGKGLGTKDSLENEVNKGVMGRADVQLAWK
jgi:hypothetical protein